VFTFEVKAPIFVFRQWHRHRTWSFNEVSARYTELPTEYYIPEEAQVTTQSSSNKQMRTDVPLADANILRVDMNYVCQKAFGMYKHLLSQGMPRELARCVLPMGTYSSMFATVDLHNLMHFLRLRLHEHAQYEIRVYAEAIRALIRPIVPVTMEAFNNVE
jgi:thymidylate synthase (FAD)